MKIRIKGNSVRFRLTQTEVKTICEKDRVTEKTQFNEAQFIYGVKASNDYDSLHASFFDHGIMLFVPKDALSDWYTNDRVGFYHTQILNNGQKLELTLEKDFVCLDNRTEDESDNYPNPRGQENIDSKVFNPE
ncbi:hypothetical protein SAMN05421636_10750 [Pricia antarctica]|uniref:Uncharacterized protein n=1 Tax=Pricia antarctica TaxID=641691 RepID=A0A1G7FBX1_9FLAO|nr:hypothetical protein [Pricia antarctica]SDE73383.1 hypothetical protein SAMN05421636_10750 [Pricia antarctica]